MPVIILSGKRTFITHISGSHPRPLKKGGAWNMYFFKRSGNQLGLEIIELENSD